MNKFPELVESYHDVRESVGNYNSELPKCKVLQERLLLAVDWYYIPEIDSVGPSKFIGYKGMTCEYYDDHTGKGKKKGLNGGVTEGNFKKLGCFQILEYGTDEYRHVFETVRDLVGQYGKFLAARTHRKYYAKKGWKKTA